MLENFIKSISNCHANRLKSNIMIFTTPRSGSTWLMESIWTQKGFKICNEPLNIRDKTIRKKLGVHTWNDLYREMNKAKIEAYLGSIAKGHYGFLNPNPLRK